MVHRRQFLKKTVSLTVMVALFPALSFTAFSQTSGSVESAQENFSYLMKNWIALYDVNGSYITDIKLIKSVTESSNDKVEQFSLRWEIKDEMTLTSGTYLLEDFVNTPMPIYLEQSYSKSKPGKYYRASFGLLKQPIM